MLGVEELTDYPLLCKMCESLFQDGSKRDDPPRLLLFVFTKTRRTVKDDIRTDHGTRKEVDFVPRVVRRLFWAIGRQEVVAHLCQRTTLQFAPQECRGHRPAIQDQAPYFATFS